MNLHWIKKNTLKSDLIAVFLMALALFNSTNGVASLTPANCTKKTTFVGEHIELECNVTSRYSSLWKWNDERLFAGTTRTTYYQNIDIDEDKYSLKLNSVSILNDGTYLCLENGEKRIEYCLEVIFKQTRSIEGIALLASTTGTFFTP
ncbi:uncharacterized protein [Apostichopus japonicus]|uniref:uncharacterized protein n=1 Tax=Stichopus japonicus TaxID=307972 RepID=UPI003AB71FA4